jgi:hypothetical protein
VLWFYHPRPFNRKEVAVQMAARKAEAEARIEFITIDHAPHETPGLRLNEGPEASEPGPIRFDVSYALGEYLSILGEHVGYLDKKSRRARRFAPGLLPALGCALIAAAAQLAGVTWLACAAIACVLLVAALYLPFMVGPWVALIATPIFLLKRWRMGSCGFTIDHESIDRVTARGRRSKTWRDVLAVHRYSQGYLMVFRKGAIPIPYRCLDFDQSQRLRALVAARPR